MKNKINNFILGEKPHAQRIGTEREIRKMRELMDHISHSKGKGYFIESFIVFYQLMQEIFLSDLRKLVLYKLGLDKLVKKFADENNTYNVNLEYVALTHDIELFDLLEKTRKMRNEIVHRIIEDETLETSQNKAKEALRLVGRLILAIIDRLQGKKAIPVLTLYARGWNDYRAQTIKIINKL